MLKLAWLAAWLFGAADAQHRVLGIRLRRDEEADHARLVGATRRRLGKSFLAGWSDGEGARIEDAVNRAAAAANKKL